jgi:hypothetical protein
MEITRRREEAAGLLNTQRVRVALSQQSGRLRGNLTPYTNSFFTWAASCAAVHSSTQLYRTSPERRFSHS